MKTKEGPEEKAEDWECSSVVEHFPDVARCWSFPNATNKIKKLKPLFVGYIYLRDIGCLCVQNSKEKPGSPHLSYSLCCVRAWRLSIW